MHRLQNEAIIKTKKLHLLLKHRDCKLRSRTGAGDSTGTAATIVAIAERTSMAVVVCMMAVWRDW